MPIHMFREERMFLDLVCAARAQPSRRVTLQESRHDALRVWRHVRGEYEGVGEDALVHDVHVFVVEWREAGL